MSYFPDPHSFVFVASSFMYCIFITHLAPQVEAVQHFLYGIPIGGDSHCPSNFPPYAQWYTKIINGNLVTTFNFNACDSNFPSFMP